ncbi:MAG: NosD domain-containing protein [Candidatus Bathyarchaeia archaeon]
MKKTFVLLLVFVFLIAFCIYIPGLLKNNRRPIIVPNDYSTIQAAINAASEGDTIFVKSGTYHECILIDKSLFLVGENSKTTIIIGDWRLNGTVVLIHQNNVSITGFTIQPAYYSYSRRGIHLLHVSYCNIFGNVILNNAIGIWLYGSSENNIARNTIIGPSSDGWTSCGISVVHSPNNQINANIIKNNAMGVGLYSSSGSTVHRNTNQ